MEPTSPRRTPKNHGSRDKTLQPAAQNLKAITLDPDNLIPHPVDVRVMSGALEHGAVLFDGEDLVPPTRTGKGDGVAPCAREGVD